jgi:hypothetical protein
MTRYEIIEKDFDSVHNLAVGRTGKLVLLAKGANMRCSNDCPLGNEPLVDPYPVEFNYDNQD